MGRKTYVQVSKIKAILIFIICIIYSNIKHHQYNVPVHSDLSYLAHLDNKWGMKFASEKCNTLSVKKSQCHTKYEKH
jgi:hypothetical protein